MAEIIKDVNEEDRIVIECLAERCKYNKVNILTMRKHCGRPKLMVVSADHQCNLFTSKRE